MSAGHDGCAWISRREVECVMAALRPLVSDLGDEAMTEAWLWDLAVAATNAIATEARRAETTGSACEGAGLKGIAQKDQSND